MARMLLHTNFREAGIFVPQQDIYIKTATRRISVLMDIYKRRKEHIQRRKMELLRR